MRRCFIWYRGNSRFLPVEDFGIQFNPHLTVRGGNLPACTGEPVRVRDLVVRRLG